MMVACCDSAYMANASLFCAHLLSGNCCNTSSVVGPAAATAAVDRRKMFPCRGRRSKPAAYRRHLHPTRSLEHPPTKRTPSTLAPAVSATNRNRGGPEVGPNLSRPREGAA